MSFIKWTPALSVNVVEIDQQHQGLIRMLNELADAIQEETDREILGKTLDGLIKYADQHFKTEEQYFVKFDFPDAEMHKAEHHTFTLKVLEYQDKYQKEELFLSIDLLNFMCEWLKHHIRETDAGYSQFFNEKGLR